ncbi:MAG: peroxidase [Betaproteobacteria bacterium]|nr:MAG: peroxidase [Betaproteobacteria bacterium]
MAFLKSLPPNAVLLELFKAFPETSKALLAYHEILMRGPSPLTAAERELIAAFVSGLNACHYCHGVHEATARQFGVNEATMGSLLTDVGAAPVEARLKPLLGYVRKLTLEPSRMTRDDADQVFAAGWDDRALHDAVSVCALFNFMNRLVSGAGIDAGGEYFALAAKRLHDGGYGGLAKLLG